MLTKRRFTFPARQLTIDDCLLLARIAAGVKRIEANDWPPEAKAQALAGMERNRTLVLSGSYVIRQVNEEMIGAFGAELAKISRYYRRPQC